MWLGVALPLLVPLLAAAPIVAVPRARPASTPAPADECRPQDRVELNLAAWKAALKRAETPRRHAEVLSELNLSLALGDSEGSDAESEGSPDRSQDRSDSPGTGVAQLALLGIDDDLAQLGTGTLPDHVIQVRYRVERGDEKMTAYLIQVARPFGGASWCLLGSDLSRQDADRAKLESYGLGFVPLLTAKKKGIEVKIVQAQLRHSEIIRQYWVIDGFKLSKVFDQEIGHMDNIGGSGETLAKSSTVALVGDFPRRIEVKENSRRVVCDTKNDDTPCKETERSSTAVFAYDGKVYVRRKLGLSK